MEDELLPEVKELRSQLALERQNSYTLDQKLKSLQRDSNLESQQLKLKLKAEQEKTSQLENFITNLSATDSTMLQIQNSVLQSKLSSLEQDYELLKSKLLEDFSNKETHIVNLSETNQLLEEELKNYQELSLTKTKVNTQKLASLEELVKELSKKNQEMGEQMLRQAESFEEEIDNLRHELEKNQVSLEQKKKEYLRTMEKLEEERSVGEKLLSDLNELEERFRSLENDNEQLVKHISNREKKIKSLSQDLNSMNEDSQDAKDEEIEKFVREVKNLNRNLKVSRDQCLALNTTKDELNTKIENLKLDFQKKLEINEREKKCLSDLNNKLQLKILKTIKKSQTNLEALSQAKDQIISDLKNSLLLLKQEKLDLENTLQEFQDQIQVSRASFGNEISLNDELMQLRESYNSRCSTPRNHALESKKAEKLHNEISEKELQIQILRSENASLKSQLESLVPALLAKHPEHQSLLAEKKRVETEFELAKEFWANENSNLRSLLEETEAIAINSSLRFAEAATDRDLFYKMYLDYKKSSEKKSWFRKNNK